VSGIGAVFADELRPLFLLGALWIYDDSELRGQAAELLK
jgi:hypothetical protein